jgi:oligopeptide transport system ATP-binding protein
MPAGDGLPGEGPVREGPTGDRSAGGVESGALLEARDLHKTYATGSRLPLPGARRGRISAVAGVDVALRPGETLGIVGESGCGKSTLARMLVGLERPDAGQVLFRGTDVAAVPVRERRALRRRIQMVFQDPYLSLDPRMTVLDLVAEPLDVHGLASGKSGLPGRRARRDRVAELLALVGLDPDSMTRYPHEFSGGQRQRIGIARALALEPEVLICDEPVSSLDVSVQAKVVNLLRRLQHQLGLTLMFIAHDLALVRVVADRIAVMYLGRLAEIGTAGAVFGSPQHPYTHALLSAVPVPDPSVRRSSVRRAGSGGASVRAGSGRIRLAGEPPSPADPPPGCRFHTRCWRADETCRSVEPTLQPHGPEGQLAACHHPGPDAI